MSHKVKTDIMLQCGDVGCSYCIVLVILIPIMMCGAVLYSLSIGVNNKKLCSFVMVPGGWSVENESYQNTHNKFSISH